MLYRRHRAFPAYLAALIAVVVVLPLGFLVGRGTAPKPSLAAELAPALSAVQQAQGTLDVVDLEYARAAGGRTGGTPEPGASLTAARDAARQGLQDLDQARDLARLYPERARAARADFEALLRAIDQRSAVDAVHTLTKTLRSDLAALTPAL